MRLRIEWIALPLLFAMVGSCRIAGICLNQAVCNRDEAVSASGGSTNCTGDPKIGTFSYSTNNEEITFDASCNFTRTLYDSGGTTLCSEGGTYTSNNTFNTATPMTITFAGPASTGSCTQVGAFSCTFTLTGTVGTPVQQGAAMSLSCPSLPSSAGFTGSYTYGSTN